MIDEVMNNKQKAKWIIGIITCCILIYIAISNIDSIGKAIIWAVNLTKPIIIGIVLALILNVPMSFIERKVIKKNVKGKRSLSILLSLVLIIGRLFGIAVLVIPELVGALKIIINIISDWMQQLSLMESNMSHSTNPRIEYLAQIDIDWMQLKSQMETWFKAQSNTFANHAIEMIGTITGGIASVVLGLVFAIYILARKEKLKAQVSKLVRTWLPEKISHATLYIAGVCSGVFQKFIAGQTSEAIILGTLCMIGMTVLRIPYAPMVGALVGVTALVPIVGAFVGVIVGGIMILTVAPFKALVFVIFFLILQQIEGNLIYPKVVGSKISLPAIWVLAAITIGGNLAGPLGMFLGVPAMSSIYMLVKEATNARDEKKGVACND